MTGPRILSRSRRPCPNPLCRMDENATGLRFCHYFIPEGYELDPKFVGNARVEYDQMKASLKVQISAYKNWAAYTGDTSGLRYRSKDRDWTVSDRHNGCNQQRYFPHALSPSRYVVI